MMTFLATVPETINAPVIWVTRVLEAGPGWSVLVDVGDWTRLTRVVRSGLDWSQTSLDKRSHESRNGTQANTR